MPRAVISDSSRSAGSAASELLGIVIEASPACAPAIQREIPMIKATRTPRGDHVRAARSAVAGPCDPVATADPLSVPSRGGLRPYVVGQRQRFVGALQELDGHEDHLLVAEIFEIVDLELAGSVGLVPRLARRIGVFDGGAVVHVLAPAAAAHRGPEIIEHVAVEADALAGREADDPHPHAIGLRYQGAADARVGIGLLALEFRGDGRRPRRPLGLFRMLVQHRESHGIPPGLARYIATLPGWKWRGSTEWRGRGARWWSAGP